MRKEFYVASRIPQVGFATINGILHDYVKSEKKPNIELIDVVHQNPNLRAYHVVSAGASVILHNSSRPYFTFFAKKRGISLTRKVLERILDRRLEVKE